jgi:hypothetical protein
VNVIHSFALPSFWECYQALPPQIRDLADKQFRLFRENPARPSVGFARKGELWTAEIGRSYRAIGRRHGEEIYCSGSGPTKPTTAF